jgi:hypothetical protein
MTQPHEPKAFHIVVNAEEKTVHQATVTFEEVCKLAFPDGPFGGNVQYTVTYTGPRHRQGSMVEGCPSIELENGLIFHVGNTDRS